MKVFLSWSGELSHKVAIIFMGLVAISHSVNSSLCFV
jgi:hypothetical protein